MVWRIEIGCLAEETCKIRYGLRRLGVEIEKHLRNRPSGQPAAFLERVQTHFLDPNGLALFRRPNFIKLD